MGVFTSSQTRAVDLVIPMLEKAAGAGEPLFPPHLVFSRNHSPGAAETLGSWR